VAAIAQDLGLSISFVFTYKTRSIIDYIFYRDRSMFAHLIFMLRTQILNASKMMYRPTLVIVPKHGIIPVNKLVQPILDYGNCTKSIL
jgi:hypothetical protein